MADNVTVTNSKTSFEANTNTDYTTATKEIGGAHYQKQIQTDESGVALGTEANPVYVQQGASVSAITTEAIIAVGTSSTSVLGANADRNPTSWVRNISDTDIYVSLSGTATTSKPTVVRPDGVFVLGVYKGAVSAIHGGSGSKSLEVVEL